MTWNLWRLLSLCCANKVIFIMCPILLSVWTILLFWDAPLHTLFTYSFCNVWFIYCIDVYLYSQLCTAHCMSCVCGLTSQELPLNSINIRPTKFYSITLLTETVFDGAGKMINFLKRFFKKDFFSSISISYFSANSILIFQMVILIRFYIKTDWHSNYHITYN